MSKKIESKTDQLLHKAANSGDLGLLKKVLDSGRVHVDCCDDEGTTALMLASANNHMDCAKLLIEEGAEVCAQRHSGTHALFFAAQGGHLELLRFLIEVGSNVNLGSKDGGSPLLVASQCGHLTIVEELLKNGAEVDSEMEDRATPLFIASQNGHLQVVRFLLAKGAGVNKRRNDGASPLWIASQMGRPAVVKELLRNGADVNCAREDGASPLFKAAHKGHIGVIEELLVRRPNLGLLGNGESALHAASLFGHLPVVKLLIQAGASASLRNKCNETPIDLAQQMGYDHIVDYLRTFTTSPMTSPTTKMITGPHQNGTSNARRQRCTDV